MVQFKVGVPRTEALVVGVREGKPVFLQDAASVRDGALPALRYAMPAWAW